MIAIIIGTRAELIKTFPVMIELEKRNKEYIFIHTGQHDLGKLCTEFKIKNPDIVLTPPPTKSSKFYSKHWKAIMWNLGIVPRIKSRLKKIKNLEYVMYHGDTMTTASAAIASSKLLNPRKKYKNIHLEAGLRTSSIFEPFPEEISRRICDRFSDILFAVSKKTKNNLKGLKGEKINVGNTILDAAEYALKISKTKAPKEDYILMTVHRHENIKNKERLTKITRIIKDLPIKTIFPLHDNTLKKLVEFNLIDKIKENKNIKIVPIKNYPEFINYLANCKLLITDGGSIQEESLLFKKPCILLRKKTERDEGLKSGINFLTGLNVNATKKIIKNILSPKYKIPKYKNPYGEPGVSKKIVDLLEKWKTR